MSIFSLWVINKAGGLIYDKTFTPGLASVSQNDLLVLAGTLHGIHAITAKLSPVDGPAEGLEIIQGDGVKMVVMLTLTGTKFVLLLHPSFPTPPPPHPSSPAKILLQKIYEAYSDAVMKNPFHTPEMPIRSNDAFDGRVESLIRAAISQTSGTSA
ncbi:transport protein particle complex subunit [Phaffia rhodozyma]|uniref:Trafficking protein particle complex subunit n=1 Tax=Phaffia rhodozyma TaxID=264483 RepID=A0A0F7SJ05_PHARH|nr:transport protein particle complex subunit [Phaffia rhodozyma]